jgi:hypothetical protein
VLNLSNALYINNTLASIDLVGNNIGTKCVEHLSKDIL